MTSDRLLAGLTHLFFFLANKKQAIEVFSLNEYMLPLPRPLPLNKMSNPFIILHMHVFQCKF